MHRCLFTFASDTFRVPRLLLQPGKCFFAVLSHLNIDRVERMLKDIKIVKEKLFFSLEQYVLQKYRHPVGILRHSWQGPEICNVMQSFILYGQTVGHVKLTQLDHLELNDNSRWYPDCPIAIIGKLLDLRKMVNLMMKKLELISDKLS